MNSPQPRTRPCRHCGGQGFFSTPIHYLHSGLSPVTYCSCALGRRLLSDWIRQPEQQTYARQLKTDRIRRALERSQLGPQFAHRRLADLGELGLRQACRDYVQQWPTLGKRGQGLYLWGPVGSGKTHAAAAVVNELIRTHLVEPLFISVPEAAARLRQALREESDRDGVELLDHMKDVELLVLDALGLETPSAWIGEQLYRVIDARWRERRPLIVTSTLSLPELARRYPPQIASRLEGGCQAIAIARRNHRATG